jgi:hypothetical protein
VDPGVGPRRRARLRPGMISSSVKRYNRVSLTRQGFDPVETPIVVVGLAGSVPMAVLARPVR